MEIKIMKTFLTKLTSRKFILAVAVFLVALVGVDDSTVSIVMATVSALGYMLSEAIVDKARAITRTITTSDTATVIKEVTEDEDK